MTRGSLKAAVMTATVVGSIVLGAGGAVAATPLPVRVYAPYFETWTTDSITTVSQQSGVKFFTLAFLETTGKSSCTLGWDGSKTQPISGGRYLSEILALRAAGGDAFPSFGGWSADQGGTEIGDSCKDPALIAAAYEEAVIKYNLNRLDMDIEGRSLTKTDGIDRRNKAIKLLQTWAAGNGRNVQISYTLPTSRDGLEASGLAVLQNALANGVRIDVVNPMVFDYYDRVTADMGDSAILALQGLHAQLTTLHQGLGKTSAQIWAMEGATIMNGLDDYPRKTESTSVLDAQDLVTFANANGMNTLSMWAIQRDNGGCPGSTGSNDCSGIIQGTWDFSNVLSGFHP
jgi:Glycosyl hydrolases family 18